MYNPKVSVLIPTYNYGHYLSEAIESVLAQTYGDFELVIVDNCSTDSTKEIVHSYLARDARIRYIRNYENIGMFRNFNQALLSARGEYIKFLNADDMLSAHALQSFMEVIESFPDVRLVTSHKQHIGLQEFISYQPKTGKIDGKSVIGSVLKNGNWIGEPTTVMFRKELNIGLFDPSLLYFADVDMWMRILSKGDLYVLDKVLSFFRIHEEQGTAHLHATSDKIMFNLIQWIEYVRFSIQSNRFGYDFTKDDTMYGFQKKHIIGFINHYTHLSNIKNEKKRVRTFLNQYFWMIVRAFPSALLQKIRRTLNR